MNIKIPSPVVKAQIKFIAESKGITPEQFLSDFISERMQAAFNHAKAEVEVAAAIREDYLASIGRKPNKQIANEVLADIGDRGTCCIGMELRYQGHVVAEGIAQGNLTNYEYFERVIDAMIQFEGADRKYFYIEDGRMD